MKFPAILSLLFITSFVHAQKQTTLSVYFDTDKAVIRTSDARKLDSLVAGFSSSEPNRSIEIYGHCDQRASNGYNDTLSLARVASTKKYLLDKGVPVSSIIREEGYGEMRPAGDDAPLWLNRRVDIVISIPENSLSTIINTAETPKEKTISTIIGDSSFKTGTNITLKDLNFIGGRHHLLNSSLPVLQQLLSALQQHPNLVIQIEGHVCCISDNADGYDYDTRTYNLSEERAKAIYEWLISYGIDEARLSHIGYGHRKPIYPYPERSELERISNRRVEIKIIKK